MAGQNSNQPQTNNDFTKSDDLLKNTENGTDKFLNTNQGVRINDDQNSLTAGTPGPTLMEDFILREKITHFDHERIPERVVHARGAGAHGFFELYESLAPFTKAGFLTDTSRKTSVFVRFSTVAGSRGSTDLARDVRGFAVKFYTEEGIFDLVGNNMPVFFIQDAIKFPDLVHAVKPEPHNEIPQAASAHDTFWDFISLMPESTHMIMWLMSDRAIPRSYRMMEGFGVHTFRLVNDKNEAFFVKFHWKPLLGVHSVAWDEAQKISGKDPDFHRRDLWDAIENGMFPEWELGLQIVPEQDEMNFEFDLLDPTKIIPEEIVPVRRVGKLTLNRNPDNFFAETEQVAFHVGNVVPGIDFTNDPLLQGRLFSYLDTQLIRLGGPNFHEIPINRPINKIHNNQRDGYSRQTINQGRVSYHPNSLNGGCPFQSGMIAGGFTSYTQRIDGNKIRQRSESFLDHFSQATLFYNSQSDEEKEHIISAFSFELGKVETIAVRERMLRTIAVVDRSLANGVAYRLGLHIPKELPVNESVPADADPGAYQSKIVKSKLDRSEALSMANTVKESIQSRKIAILIADGVHENAVLTVKAALEAEEASVVLVAHRQGKITTEGNGELLSEESTLTAASVLFDAVYIPGGIQSSATLAADGDIIHFLNEAYRHCKAIAADETAMQVIENTCFAKAAATEDHLGIIIEKDPAVLAGKFIAAIARHRFWEREKPGKVPA